MTSTLGTEPRSKKRRREKAEGWKWEATREGDFIFRDVLIGPGSELPSSTSFAPLQPFLPLSAPTIRWSFLPADLPSTSPLRSFSPLSFVFRPFLTLSGLLAPPTYPAAAAATPPPVDSKREQNIKTSKRKSSDKDGFYSDSGNGPLGQISWK